jgi:hypothetical protein
LSTQHIQLQKLGHNDKIPGAEENHGARAGNRHGSTGTQEAENPMHLHERNVSAFVRAIFSRR